MPGRQKRVIGSREKKWRYDVFVLVFLAVILMPLYYVVNYAYGLFSDITDLGTAQEMTQEEIDEYRTQEADDTLTDSSQSEINEADALLREFAELEYDVADSEQDGLQHILLIGCDTLSYDKRARSDSMIILTIDRQTGTIKMTSLMRDMRVNIPGYGYDKLNAAFAYDSSGQLLLDTIRENFLIDIEDYVCVNYAAFTSVVDLVGGIWVNVEEDEYEAINLSIYSQDDWLTGGGEQLLNGTQALAFCRMRKIGYDMGRTARQRQALSALMDKVRQMSAPELLSIVSEMAPNIKTNLNLQELLSLALEAAQVSNYTIEQMRLPVDGTWSDLVKNKIWYIKFDLASNVDYLHEFIFAKAPVVQSEEDEQPVQEPYFEFDRPQRRPAAQ